MLQYIIYYRYYSLLTVLKTHIYPKNIDPRPHRRHNKDNPYTIFTVGINTDTPHYYVSFKDGQGVRICMEIDKSIYELLDKFELEDLSYLLIDHIEVGETANGFDGIQEVTIHYRFIGNLLNPTQKAG